MAEDNLKIIALLPGTTLCGSKYVIERKIGQGGFGIAYKAVQAGLGRTVCIKEYFLDGKCVRDSRTGTVCCIEGSDFGEEGVSREGANPADSASEKFEKYRRTFVTEARTLATLKHPNIVEVLDVFDENGTSYMVMPFIEGISLKDLVDSKGKLSYAATVNYIAQITDAVGYIHERHILHRDIKPDNIMITSEFKAVLIDFGSARKFLDNKTQGQTSIVTPGYAPPEQYSYTSRKGAYTDIYAIGATLYFALTGVEPINAAARLSDKLPEPKSLSKGIPDEANRTILKAMQLEAENRHQSIREFMDDLTNTRPSRPVGKRRFSGLYAGLAGVAVILAVASVVSVVKSGHTEQVVNQPQTVDFVGHGMYPMIEVKGGTFVMGDDEYSDCPSHKVRLGDFYIGQYEVSQKFWKSVLGRNPSDFQYSNHDDLGLSADEFGVFPVENVSFSEIREFIARLNEKTGRAFSLPSEAQWEYAARGGRKRSDLNGGYAAGSLYGDVWYGKEFPAKIMGTTDINELGIHHMGGNVAEWCEDYYSEDYYYESDGEYNPVNEDSRKNRDRVARGGSFNDMDCVTAFYRDHEPPQKKRKDLGFRLILNK